MKKTAIITDSNSGITQLQAKELGIFVIPMPFNINHETYFEEIDFTQEDFYKKLEEGADISTSQPSLEQVMTLWDDVLRKYEEIVHIPMSSSLSGSYETAVMLSNDYDNKIKVVDNQRISITQRQSVLDALKLSEQGVSAENIKEHLEQTKQDSSIYITLETLKYLKKGGRITPAAAALGTLLKIKPILQIQGGKLDAYAKSRTMKQSKVTMIDAVKKDFLTRFNSDDSGKNMVIQIAYSGTSAQAIEFKEELKEIFPLHPDIHVDPLSLSIACHIGPGALAIACTKISNYTGGQL